MKILFFLSFLLILSACENSSNEASADESDRLELLPEPDKDMREKYEDSLRTANSDEITQDKCSALDILKLKEDSFQTQFFSLLDSIRKVQYPNDDQEKSIMVDLTKDYLTDFLRETNKDSLLENNRFEKEYHFNLAPDDYTDPKECKDNIQVRFDDENCHFTITVYNSFLVEPNWCTESAVIYGFNIKGNRIFDFSRNEAG